MKEIVGVELVDYVSKKTAKRVVGKKLHMVFDSDNVDGLCVESVYVPERVECAVKVGDKVKIYYDKFNQVEEVLVRN